MLSIIAGNLSRNSRLAVSMVRDPLTIFGEKIQNLVLCLYLRSLVTILLYAHLCDNVK